ncbi:MAG: Asp-tRNA(Asn)/Glu-tRNA(Gln) amidotransferase subunit GatC [Saprospiraceae bacterium]
MKVDKPLISKLENLAKLALSEQEKALLLTDMNNILSMVEKLDSLDTESVAPLIHMGDRAQVLRKDEVKHELSTAEALKNAVTKADPFFTVPKVIDLD